MDEGWIISKLLETFDDSEKKEHKEFFTKLNINFTKIQELMSRDFLIFFKDEHETKISEEILNKIKLKNQKLFQIDNRGTNLFVTLVYPNEIFQNDYLDNSEICLFNYISFVAIKNGMHSQKGFYYDNFSNYKRDQMNIVNIKEIIFNFFK